MTPVKFGKDFRVLALMAVLCAGLAGCATHGGDDSEIADPLYGMNKAIFAFNDVADQAVIRPVAKGYRAAVPQPARKGATNFFRNLRAPVNLANELLQGDLNGAGTVLTRTTVNTFIGVGGLVDVAAMEGIPYKQEDFGQTLGVWGVGHGAYLVLPILGPSSLRDGSGMIVDMAFDPLNWYFHNVSPSNEGWRYGRMAAEGIIKREELLDVLDDLRRNSFDYYTAMRSAYVQRRAAQIRNSDAAGVIPNYTAEY